jgi:tRNA G18 (ribose-2'-O)-methylase SpoU
VPRELPGFGRRPGIARPTRVVHAARVRVERIESLDDPRVAEYRNLRDVDLRAGSNLFMTEGRLGVRRLVRGSRFRARSVFVTPAALDGLGEVLGELEEETPVYLASQAVLNQVVGYDMHRGCLAAAERGAEPGAEALLEACATGRRRLVVLEDVTNPDNVGAVFRNARAFGADAVLLTPRCADPLYRKAIRVSMGAALQLPFARIGDCGEAFARLRAAGFPVVACTPDAEAEPIDAAAERLAGAGRLALAFGTEGEGLSDAALAAADARVQIPMAPGVDSLNVATASGIALHRFALLEGPGSGGRPCGR